jgi:hypothetical protein
MENTEKELSANQSMDIIKSMIATAKNNVSDDGFHFLLWGVLVIAASLGQYFLAINNVEKNFLPWMVMPLVGAPVSFLYERRLNREKKVKTLFDEIVGRLWMGAGITMFAAIFISIQNHVSTVPFILCIIGLATFVSGSILKFKPLIAGGVVFWIAAFATTAVTPINQLLINAGATFLGYIIPGILLWKEYKREGNVQAA